MASEPKVVRLTNTQTGITVETTEEVAQQLRGYEPENTKTTAKKASSSKSSK